VRRAVAHAARLTALDALRARQIIALRDGRLDEASTLAEQVARRAPSSQAWFDVATVHVAADRCAEAITAFERAIAVDSTHTRSRIGLAECSLSLGNTAVALRHLDAARRIDSVSMPAVEYALQRGRVLARANRFGEADSAFRAMFSGIAADSAAAFRWLAQLQMLRGRYGEALPMLQSASRLSRQVGDTQGLFDNLVLEANAFTAIGGRTRGSELIDEAIAVAIARPVSVNGYFQLGHLMARIGRLNGAREILRQASVRVAQEGGANQWPIRLLTASLHVAERNGADALTNVDAQGAPIELEPFRLALSADANALAGQHEAALAAARRLAQSWHFGDGAQDEWLRATLRIARFSEMSGDTATARATYQMYVDRWKDADVFLVELSVAQRSLVRLGGAAIAMNPAPVRGR
jgi:tetratricopeptide (TPR) repeat protein